MALDPPPPSGLGAPRPWACLRCGRGARVQLARCPACASLHTFIATAPTLTGARALNARTARALLATLPRARHTTGSAAWDEALGGGAVPSTAVLVGGRAGVGKSRALLRLVSDLAAATIAPPLYLTFEEPPEQVASVARDVGADLDRLRIIRPESLTEALASIRALFPMLPFVIVWDSVHAVPGVRARYAVRAACRIGQDVGAVSFLVSHVAKDGTFADSETIRHDVDVVAAMVRDEKGTSLVVSKNRFGPAPLRVALGR